MANILEMYLQNPETAASDIRIAHLTEMAAQAEMAGNTELATQYSRQIEMLRQNPENPSSNSLVSRMEAQLKKAEQEGNQEAQKYYRAELAKLKVGEAKTEGTEGAPKRKGMKIKMSWPRPGEKIISFKGPPARAPHSTPAHSVKGTPARIIYSTPARAEESAPSRIIYSTPIREIREVPAASRNATDA